jgi:hypothetical protein
MCAFSAGQAFVTHVFVVAAGYGKRVVPVTAPCEFAITTDGVLRVTSTASVPVAVRCVARDAMPDAEDLADPVADIIEGPRQPEWWLDAGFYAMPLPPGWTALATGDSSPAFYLVRETDRMVFVQTARNRPTLDALAAPGQSVIDRGTDDRAEWVELSYVLEGVAWRQRHTLMRSTLPVMVTAQAPRDVFDEVRAVQDALVRQVVLDAPASP